MNSVAIVGMGGSVGTLLSRAAAAGGLKNVATQIWTVNSMGGIVQSDLIFAMDDLRWIAQNPDRDPLLDGLITWMKATPTPLMTSRAYPEFPTSEAYPLQDVLNHLPNAEPYLNTTVAYMVAYAMASGFEEIQFYGCDFSYPDRHIAESGRGCCEWLLGVAMERGIRIVIAADSTLMDAADRKLYGYLDPPPKIIRDPATGGVTVWIDNSLT